MSFYSNMAATATKLLTKFQQGSIAYVETLTTGDAWNPQPGVEVVTPLTATAAGVSKQYIDGKLVVETDLEITAPVFGTDPKTTGIIRLDGRDLQIVKVIQIPAAGEIVAWKIVARA